MPYIHKPDVSLFTWGYRYLIYFYYLQEDRRTPEFHLRYKHTVQFSILNIRIFTLIVRSYSKGVLFLRDKEINF